MSPYFVKQFRSKNPCKLCRKSKPNGAAPGKSLCPSHLAIARLSWRIWAVERREMGKCCNCNRKSQKMNVRCKTHREENRVKCEKWSLANPGHGAAQWESRKDQINTGFCICRDRNPLAPGKRRCETCRTYSKALAKGDNATVEKIRVERRARRFAKDAEILATTRAQLAALGYEHTRGPAVRRLSTETV